MGFDSKLAGYDWDFDSLAVKPSNLNHLIFGQFGLPMPRTSRVDKPSLGYHIGRIVLWGSDKQMVRPNTKRRVASVAYKEPFWNFPKMDKPRMSVGQNIDPVYNKKTVAISCSSPKPAGFSFVDFVPEVIDLLRRNAKLGLNHKKSLSFGSESGGVMSAALYLFHGIRT